MATGDPRMNRAHACCNVTQLPSLIDTMLEERVDRLECLLLDIQKSTKKSFKQLNQEIARLQGEQS